MYPKPIDNFVLGGSLFFFCIFFLWVILGKIASKENAIAALNKAHFQIGICYVLSSIPVILWKFSDDFPYALLALLVGLFCYFTYHYVFLMSIIGPAKKSISANIVVLIKSASGRCQMQELLKSYGGERGFSFIKGDRLKQMLFLNFADEHDLEYEITLRGKVINSLGRLILRIWNLERL